MGKTVVVTGASGFVGRAVCKELLDNDYIVRALIRDRKKSSLVPDGAAIYLGDIKKPDSLKHSFFGADYLIHIAAIFRQAGLPDKEYWDTNTEGVRNVLEVAVKAGIKKVVHCSTGGVHSHIPNPPANEDEPYRPADLYQVTKCEGEKIALDYFRNGRINGVVIRPAMIWGPGDKRTQKLFKGIAKKTLPIVGSGKVLFHWVMVDDLARAFRLALEKDIPSGETFLIAGERFVAIRELYDLIAKEFGVKVLPFRVPALPLKALGAVCEVLCKPFGVEPPIFRRRVDFFTKTRAFSTEKAQRMLGFKPTRTLEEEVRLICNWYKEHGWVR